MGSCRGGWCRGAALGSSLLPSLAGTGHGMAVGSSDPTELWSHQDPSLQYLAPSPTHQPRDPAHVSPHPGRSAAAARRAQCQRSPASLPVCHDLGSASKAGAVAASVLPSRSQAGSTEQPRESGGMESGGAGDFY